MSSTCENIEEGIGGVGGGGCWGGLGGDGGNLQLVFNDLCLDESLGRGRGDKRREGWSEGEVKKRRREAERRERKAKFVDG